MADDRARELARSRRRLRVGLVGRLVASTPALNAAAATLAGIQRFVHATNRFVYEPVSGEELFARHAPLILTFWHGQAFLFPTIRPKNFPTDVLASRNKDGEIISRTMLRLGCGVIRGSGAPNAAQMHRKGAVAGFRGMVGALAEGRSVALTADFLKDARRKASPGIVALARMSGRPIVPAALASSRRWVVSSWDRTMLTLPFGTTACVVGEAQFVPPDADDARLESERLRLEQTLERVTARAYEIVDGRG